MTDIVEEINNEISRVTGNWPENQFCVDLAARSAAEITRLRAALREIADMIPYAMPDYTHQVWKTAHAALGGGDE